MCQLWLIDPRAYIHLNPYSTDLSSPNNLYTALDSNVPSAVDNVSYSAARLPFEKTELLVEGARVQGTGPESSPSPVASDVDIGQVHRGGHAPRFTNHVQ
jgi:hypothetical protein